MSRNALAAEFVRICREMQRLAAAGEQLAQNSGGMVDPKWFRGAQTMTAMAAGELEQKGLLPADAQQQPDEKAPA